VHFASGSSDSTINVWNMLTGDIKKTINHHSDAISSLVLLCNAKSLVTGSLDKTIKVYDLYHGSDKALVDM
jgi:WD40 repeat protein